MNLLMKQKETHRLRKQIHGYQGQGAWKRDRMGVWDLQMQAIIY